ncbi:aldehyde dehydrogenase family protein [Arthrobacter sp. CAU 1506]|uniref:aldehyde dehydrogenase family protein n=1 Tax=Arthrobacter sp. CAU 1506 TaxID=2560052 RepID=UPI0010AD9073|nr:aldehyde dehydrogenase family protein [Arthrobacter sp. CAU 1506]TJY66183.1 aldehyde dehydrogenase family protein [Arthrobacter sp. CAU 1506]
MTAVAESLMLPQAASFASAEHGAFIGGTEISTDGSTIDTVDPATGRVITKIAETDAKTVDRAVESAATAFEGEWGSMLPARREELLHRLADLIEENALELAQYDALEGGKPVTYVESVDVPLAVEQFRYYAGWPTKIQGATVPVSTPNSHVYTRKIPLGVVAAITPWNFPLCQAAIKLAPALAAGNTVVLKPSELTSLSSLRLAQLAVEAGLPAGTVNVVTGTGAATGQALVSHPQVSKISFTGSEATGRHLGAEAGRSLKHISLELGGKNPHIIFADADIAKAATYAATTAYFYSGQVCFSGSRLMVERSAVDDVLAAVKEHADALVLGHGLDRTTTMGPLSSAVHREKVEGYLNTVSGTGAKVAFGGSRPKDGGYFLEPTAVVGPADSDAVVAEEIFGPVLVIQPFDSVEELMPRANSGKYGLTAGVWTNDVRKAHTVAQRLQAGTVWVNTYADYNAAAPFGGFKSSGFGKDCGPEGLEKYLETQTVWMSLA